MRGVLPREPESRYKAKEVERKLAIMKAQQERALGEKYEKVSLSTRIKRFFARILRK
ncbi:hypothetical protein PAP_02205 [Palaeococcus pacificus DY20341]|uniref:Uncharacterized protein n=1 Tax=Palaeococcus pacificus DY20341 TaxID=1343739 RepID=A0A075LWG9_9EURY|nr:hypothetical protein [Palaeococcus pacificus]AIF68873.1 hypothetical protein PAP_02205 [Palaeococcus pacificus DY20341]